MHAIFLNHQLNCSKCFQNFNQNNYFRDSQIWLTIHIPMNQLFKSSLSDWFIQGMKSIILPFRTVSHFSFSDQSRQEVLKGTTIHKNRPTVLCISEGRKLWPIHPWCKKRWGTLWAKTRKDFQSERINDWHSLRTTSNARSPKPAAITVWLTPRVFTVAYHQLANAIAGTAPCSPSKKFAFSLLRDRTKLPNYARLAATVWPEGLGRCAGKERGVEKPLRPSVGPAPNRQQSRNVWRGGSVSMWCLLARAPPFCFEVCETRQACQEAIVFLDKLRASPIG